MPDLITAIAGLATAILGGGGIAAVLRRRAPDPGPAAAARSQEANLVALAEALAASDQRADDRGARVAVLEDRIRSCPVDGCPRRVALNEEQS